MGKLNAEGVFNIVNSVVSAKNKDAWCYPSGVGSLRPLWLRVEHNSYWRHESKELEFMLRKRLKELGRPFDKTVSVTTLNTTCIPERCFCTPIPALHGMFLFSHLVE